ncbi:MAG: carbohydrate ABC transporter permease [Ktedonobacterales bacterium]|nr:carbohydrate ABC transporter permease [Ktedonobacterales bacterium]
MSLLGAFFLLPLIFMVVGSLKPNERVLAEGDSWRAFIPTSVTGANYVDAFQQADFLHLFFNSVVITGSIVSISLVINSLFGYALARFRFRGRALLIAVVVALIIIPLESYVIPLLYMVARLQWVDTYQVQILPFIANPFYIYLFYTFFLNLPKELEEAAQIDGADLWRIFTRVMLPLAGPVFATVAILNFLSSWGQLLWPIMVTHGPEVRPLPLGVAEFQTEPPFHWGTVMAFATMMTVPTVAVFILFQNAFVRGVARSGIKG